MLRTFRSMLFFIINHIQYIDVLYIAFDSLSRINYVFIYADSGWKCLQFNR